MKTLLAIMVAIILLVAIPPNLHALTYYDFQKHEREVREQLQARTEQAYTEARIRNEKAKVEEILAKIKYDKAKIEETKANLDELEKELIKLKEILEQMESKARMSFWERITTYVSSLYQQAIPTK